MRPSRSKKQRKIFLEETRKDINGKNNQMEMDDETPVRRKNKPSIEMVAFALMLIIGVIVGVYAAQYLQEFVSPEQFKLTQEAKLLRTQNQLLKEKVDCLTNGIQQNRGKASLTECG